MSAAVPLPAPTRAPAAEQPPAEPAPIPRQIDSTMRVSILEGSLTQLFLNWTTGAVLVGYLLHFNATPNQIGLAGSIPLLMQAASPLAAWVCTAYPRPRMLTTICASLARGVWLLPAVVASLSLTDSRAVALILWAIAFSYFFQSCAGTIWSAWMGALIPPERRGTYFGTRNGIMGVVGLTANLAAGLLLDRLPTPLNFQVVIGLALLAAAGSVVLYRWHYEPPAPAASKAVGLGESFRLPLRNANFRRMLVFAFYWQASVLLAAPFVYPFLLQHIQLTFTEIAIFTAAAASTALVAGRAWGRLADKVGNRSILAISTFLAGSILPLCWMLAGPRDVGLIYLSGVLEGLAWSAINPAMFNLALATTPRRNRIAFLGMLSFTMGIAGFIGGFASGPVLHYFGQWEFHIGGFHWSAFHWLFLTSALLRTQAWRLVSRVRETRAWATSDVLRLVRHFRLIGLPWR